MTLPTYARQSQTDPILIALQLGYPINPDVLGRGIVYREALIDDLREEIDILKRASARLHVGASLAMPHGVPPVISPEDAL